MAWTAHVEYGNAEGVKEYEQIERDLGFKSRSHKWDKRKKHRIERRRGKQDPDCMPRYRKYKGWEW